MITTKTFIIDDHLRTVSEDEADAAGASEIWGIEGAPLGQTTLASPPTAHQCLDLSAAVTLVSYDPASDRAEVAFRYEDDPSSVPHGNPAHFALYYGNTVVVPAESRAHQLIKAQKFEFFFALPVPHGNNWLIGFGYTD